METRKGRHVELPKITRPEASESLLRPRLFRWLEQSDAKIAWISGPPGSGKTTLVSSFLAHRKLAHIWYQLDEGDADPATFFHYLALAMADKGSRHRAALPAPNPELPDKLACVTGRFAELISSRLEPPVLLVLDHYETVPADAPLHGIVRSLASRLARGFRLIVLSRATPPPLFAQLRVYGDLTVLESEALNLNLDEADALARAQSSLDARSPPNRARVVHLHAVTRGWLAGFKLLLADEGQRDAGFGAANASQHLLFDFFAAELFGRFPEPVQRALAAAALLPCMTVAQAEELTGNPAIGPVLSELREQNCFVSRRLDGLAIYQFHALFHAFLLDRGKASIAIKEWRVLKSRAAEITARSGCDDESSTRPGNPADGATVANMAMAESPIVITELGGTSDLPLKGERDFASWPIRVRTLGHFQVFLNDEPLQFSGRYPRKPLELLKCLCAFGGDAINEQRINDALWPDADGDAADQALRTNLHRLRKLLNRDDAIHFEGRQLSLDPRLVWTDCQRFLRVARRSDNTDPAMLRHAFNLYNGHFLAGDSAIWVFSCRENLHAHFLRLAERLGNSLEQSGEMEAAVDCYLRAVDIEPTAEHIYRRLMQTHLQLGQPAMAVAVYQRCRLALNTQLGIATSRETEALYRSILGD